MKKVLAIALTTGILFLGSATASYLWQKKQAEHAHAEGEKPAHGNERGQTSPSSVPASMLPNEPQRAAVRPPYNPGAEEIARLTSELRSRLATVREREEQLAARKKQVDLIMQDIRGERAALDELRKQVKNELDSLNEALDNLEKQRSNLDQDRQKMSTKVEKMENRMLQLQKEEHDNLKKMSSMYNTMAPESAARILQTLADTGKLDTAVKLLGLMQERQAAKVLAEVSDSTLAAQLVGKLKDLRRTPRAPASELGR